MSTIIGYIYIYTTYRVGLSFKSKYHTQTMPHDSEHVNIEWFGFVFGTPCIKIWRYHKLPSTSIILPCNFISTRNTVVYNNIALLARIKCRYTYTLTTFARWNIYTRATQHWKFSLFYIYLHSYNLLEKKKIVYRASFYFIW